MNLIVTVQHLVRLLRLGARVGLCVGFVAGSLVLLIGSKMTARLSFVLCPSSVLAMGFDSAPHFARIFVAVPIILISNAIFYAVLIGIIGMLFQRIRDSA
jgi:hypothetical protein